MKIEIEFKDIDKLVNEILPYDIPMCLCGHGEHCGYCDGSYQDELKNNRKSLKEFLLKHIQKSN